MKIDPRLISSPMPKGSWREFDAPEARVRLGFTPSNVAKSDCQVRVLKTRGGKGGKTVTEIKGLDLNNQDMKALLKTWKKKCGTGGTIKENYIELQGDQVKIIFALLEADGYSPKQSGG